MPLDEENVNLTFATISDTHMNEDESRLFLLKLGLSDMQNAEHPLDAFVLSGDVTHHAYEEHWSMLKKGFDEYKSMLAELENLENVSQKTEEQIDKARIAAVHDYANAVSLISINKMREVDGMVSAVNENGK